MHFLYDNLLKSKVTSLINAYDVIINLDAAIGILKSTILNDEDNWVWPKWKTQDLNDSALELSNNINPITEISNFSTPSMQLDVSKVKFLMKNTYSPKTTNPMVYSIFGKNGAGKTV